MLREWQSHVEYQQFVTTTLSAMAYTDPDRLLEYQDSISKLYILNLDPLEKLMSPTYSSTGAPAKNQPEIFRSLVLMNDLGYSLDVWVKDKLPFNTVLQAACGFREKLPGVASYYDFINRIIKLDEKPRKKRKKRKPKTKHGKNKLPNKHPGVVQKLVDRILKGRRFNNRPERLLQEIFAKVAVQPSVELGLIPQTLVISGDGTCIETGASHYGVRTCECRDNGVYNCDCTRRFSDPNARWGWDSHRERYFYGYMGYFISTYNSTEKLDLPLYLRVVQGNRHDSVSAAVALAEFRDLYPNLHVDTFLSDSASDNYATYQLLDRWDINAIIALNPTNTGNAIYPEHLNISENGVPICPAGREMINGGYCANRSRHKWRCPMVCKKLWPRATCFECSTSDYGRVIYTKPEWDLRLFTRIPRASHQWKMLMKQRTAAERVNNRIKNDYSLNNSRVRGKKRISFFAAIAGINVHLDAQLAKMKSSGRFDFRSIFGLTISAVAA